LALALSEEDLTIKNRILRVKRSTPNTQKQNQRPGKKTFGQQGKDQFQRRFKPKQNQEKFEAGAQRRLMNKRKYQVFNVDNFLRSCILRKAHKFKQHVMILYGRYQFHN
jgi:hypothetical protein